MCFDEKVETLRLQVFIIFCLTDPTADMPFALFYEKCRCAERLAVYIAEFSDSVSVSATSLYLSFSLICMIVSGSSTGWSFAGTTSTSWYVVVLKRSPVSSLPGVVSAFLSLHIFLSRMCFIPLPWSGLMLVRRLASPPCQIRLFLPIKLTSSIIKPFLLV